MLNITIQILNLINNIVKNIIQNLHIKNIILIFALSYQNYTIMEKKTRGLRNNNPFNIRKSKSRWIGKIKGTDKDFETFDSLEHGYRAGLVLLANYYKKYKLHSYRTILQRFAPISENNLADYEYFIFSYSRIKPDAYLSLKTLLWKIAPLIAKYESALCDDELIFDVTENLIKTYKL